MGGSKGSSGSKSYNVFGRLAAVVGVGPLAQLNAVVADGKAIYEGTQSLSSDSTDLTGLIDGKYFAAGGYLRLLRGTATQTMPAEFSHLPNYRGVAVLLAYRFLFGREKYTSPNLEIVTVRKPVVDTSIVAATDNVIDDGQCNPVAMLAELYTSAFGSFRLPSARLVASEWLAAAAWCNASAERRARTFCSPLLTDQVDARRMALDLLAMFDGAHWFDAQGRLGLKLLEPGVDPGGLPLLDAPRWSEDGRPKQDGPGWSEVPARIDVGFYDRDRKFKKTNEPAKNLIASRVLGLETPRTVEMTHVTRRAQAADWGNELVRRTSKPAGAIKLGLRRSQAAGLAPGTKVKVDVDPEPGGDGLAQICVIEEIREGPTGPVKLTVRPDTLSPGVLYVPNYGPSVAEAPAVDPIEEALIVPLPPRGFGAPLAFGVLATRPAGDIVGMRVFFDTSTGGSFTELGRQVGFAARMTLATAADDESTTLRLQLADGADGPDAYLAAMTPGAEIGAQADELLVVLANVDVDGRVVIGGDEMPELEFASVVSRTAVTSDTHDYTVLRARRGIPARSWATTCRAWIIPMTNLETWRHPALATLLATGDPGFIRLVSYRVDAEDDSSPVPEWGVQLPEGFNPVPQIAWSSPSGSLGEADGAGNVAVAFTVTDRDGDLIGLRVQVRKVDDGTPDVDDSSDEAFEATGSRSYSRTMVIALGTWSVTVFARDRAGNTTTSTRTLVRASAGSVIPPTFSPGDGMEFVSSLAVTLSTVSPATQIEYAQLALGAAQPASGTTVTALSVGLTLTSSRRIWARSKGTTNSPWIFAEYYKQGGGGGGPLLP